jgi:hypothetical protein
VAVMARTKADKKYAKAKAINTCTAKLRGKVVLAGLDDAPLEDVALEDAGLANDGAVVLELLEEFMGCEVRVGKLKARPPV